ncbi:hypothetical protein HZS_3418 [Henneguya salminicola]|nr:hypothetical protein HZS_3418 [Henneguya salminicola]
MRDQFVNTPYSLPSKNQRTAGFNRNEFDRSSYVYSIKSSSKQPTLFRRYWVGDIHGVQHKMMICAINLSLSLLISTGPTFVDETFRITFSPFYQCLIIMVFDNVSDLYIPFGFGLGTG